MSKHPVFFHSLFRTGSTYLWNRFRQNPENCCFYEEEKQFNRTAFRIKWFKRYYPGSTNIYLVRNPRDQWQSYISMADGELAHWLDSSIVTGAGIFE